MSQYRIAVMEGDGIGPEVVAASQQVVLASLATAPEVEVEFVPLPVGLSAFDEHGTTLPASTLRTLDSCDGWILGPVTTHLYDEQSMPNPSGSLRKQRDLYANIRPVRSFPGVPSLYPDVNLVVVRENTEGFYADRNVLDGNGELRPDADTVISVRVVTRGASERIARVGFELARRRRRRVTLVHKANVLKRGCGLFLDACRAVAREFPDVEVNDYHVDAFAMYLVMRPRDFDVIVTTNLFGDVLSDEAAGLVGGLGLAPSLNAGDRQAMAQAVHGSAPDIAGRGIANPIATMLSAAMLFEWLADRHEDQPLRSAAARVQRAVEQVLAEGRVRTPDLGGTATTADLTAAILRAVEVG